MLFDEFHHPPDDGQVVCVGIMYVIQQINVKKKISISRSMLLIMFMTIHYTEVKNRFRTRGPRVLSNNADTFSHGGDHEHHLYPPEFSGAVQTSIDAIPEERATPHCRHLPAAGPGDQRQVLREGGQGCLQAPSGTRTDNAPLSGQCGKECIERPGRGPKPPEPSQEGIQT